ncbi:MAG: dual specificity protein phosphatase family protein [Acidobacteriota bacterium]
MPFGFPISPSRIGPALLAGPAPKDDHDVAILVGEGVTDVLDLREDREWKTRSAEAAVVELERRGIVRHSVPLRDHAAPDWASLGRAADLIDEIVDAGEPGGRPARVLYVHCHAGIERTGYVLVAWHARRNRLTYNESLLLLRRHRPELDPLDDQERLVREWLRQY